MSTIARVPVVVPPYVDHVLDEIGRHLQITPSQFARAVQAYEAVGEWLRRKGSALAPYRPEIFPQGSMALRTTVKPLRGDEFDLDLVVQVIGWIRSAMDLHGALGQRLREHAHYRRIAEPRKRCWTLNYSGEFHLDALPGRDDVARPGNAIEVPDRDAWDWKPSNPRDFVTWFDGRARAFIATIEARGQTPLPAPEPYDAQDPLRRAVQLLKRHRDVRFEGEAENAPRSIVLTTLAAKYYNGVDSVGEALLWILDGISAEVARSRGPLVVPNPVNEDENFAESWEENPEAYREFVAYVDQLAVDMRALTKAPLQGDFRAQAGRIFGLDVAKRAVELYNEKHAAPALIALERVARGPESAPARPWCHA